MSYLVLARKHRPQTFDQVVSQEHVTQTLKNAVLLDRVAHAVLLSGPRGTGKTTVARILAKVMNCKKAQASEPCNECESCLAITSGNAVDVLEIDGASNNSVDQIRALRENARYMPAHSRYKIYIIDEVHMLSIAAFNALLKTLEEPPSHVMFIFATTEPQKIPITILSRCQRHDFRRIDIESVSKHLETICSKEEIDIDIESLQLVARGANGSMRDALSLLDQIISCSQSGMTREQIADILGIVDRKIIFDVSDGILNKNIHKLLGIVDDVYNHGYEIKKFYADIVEHFRNLLIVKMGKNINKLVDVSLHEINLMQNQVENVPINFLSQIFNLLFQQESIIKFSVYPKMALEMAFVKLFQIKPALPIDTLIEKIDSLRKTFHEKQQVDIEERQTNVFETKKLEQKVESVNFNHSENENIDVTWRKIQDVISKKHPALGASLTKCSLKKLDGNDIELQINGGSFYINRITNDKNMAIMRKVCDDFFGKKMNIVIDTPTKQSNDNPQKKTQENSIKQDVAAHPLVAHAMEIFDGRIMDVKIL